MYKHLLVATDGSELAAKAVEQGLALGKTLGAKVMIMTVTEPWTMVAPGEIGMTIPVDDYDEGVTEHATKILDAAKLQAKTSGTDCDDLHVKDRYPADGILETAKDKGCDLIIMASHGRRGIARLLIGSQANRVVTHSPIPVLICK